ncbi:MAG TPA: inorganic phosphate transporter [Chthoniobacteraceae bacterium]|jgi:PiT family inorganic phosphate transporter|nr:inorganic phosphate transporter [Chthoniobacteraceae bacterium]
MELLLVSLVLLVALVFTYTNGFHDTANAIATVVGTKVLTPRQAIMLAAVTNLIGSFFGLAVAKTISSGLVEQSFITQGILICALLAAIFWNLLTWWYGLPSSSSHALVGSLVGAALASAVVMNAAKPLTDKEGKPATIWSAIKFIEVKEKKEKHVSPAPPGLAEALGDKMRVNGTHTVSFGGREEQAVVFEGRAGLVTETPKVEKAGILYKVLVPMVTSPLAGFTAGLVVMGLLYLLLRNWRPVTVNRLFGKLQLASSAYMGFSHGMNDATKCMGIITLALVAGTNAGLFANESNWWGWLATPEGSDALKLGIGDHLIAMLPATLQFGYLPAPVDVKSQAVPDWVVVVCALTMAAGTAAGGWRIIRTLGHKMVKLQPVHGFAAETTAATVLAVTGTLGMPVSTTHAITTSIMGVGSAKRFSALKLRLIERIVWAWILTIPTTAIVAFTVVWLSHVVGWINFPPN